MTVITTAIPDKLNLQLESYVKSGWAISKEEIIQEALFRFLDSHKEDIIEAQLMSDVEWGLAKQ